MTTFLMSGLKALNKKMEDITSYTYTITKVDELTVGSAEKPTGITLYDETTNDPYCVKMQGGYLKSIFGTCNDLANPNSAQITQITETQNTSTEEEEPVVEEPVEEEIIEEPVVEEPVVEEPVVEEPVVEEPVVEEPVVEEPVEEIIIENASTTN